MTVAVAVPARSQTGSAAFFIAGIVLATLTEAVASTILSLGRGDIIGDTYATPDEFAWLDIGYTASKLIAFIVAAWLMTRINPRSLIVGSTLVMGTACAIAAITTRLDLLIALRTIQGFSGGVLLVGGQAAIFLGYQQRHQPILQALFAMGAVVAPATIAPALQGWLLDSQSWTWIFFSVVPVALAAAGLLLLSDGPTPAKVAHRPFDWIGFSLISIALFCLTYVLSQGSRWDWFEERRILWLAVIGTATLLAFLGQQMITKGRGLVDFTAFRTEDFSFAFIVSFVAGAALFGSAFLIPFLRGFRPGVQTDRRRPALVAKRRALHRRAPPCGFPHAGPPHSPDRHGAVRNPDDHGRDVDAFRLDQRERRGRHDGSHLAARFGPWLPVSVDHSHCFQ